MNNEIYLRLESLMKKLGFSVSNGSFTKAEMKAYAAAISLAESKMNAILKNTFISTADTSGLSMFLSMVGEKPASNASESKALVVSAVSDQVEIYPRSGFNKVIQAIGIGNKMFYMIDGNVINLYYSGDAYRALPDDYSKIITDYLPCTILIDNEIGHAFSEWDKAGYRWFEIDKRNIPFVTLENIK